MRAKEYLQQIEVLSAKIEQKKQRANEYRELALCSGGFDYTKERVQTSNLGGQIENPVIRYVALEQETVEDEYRLQQLKDKITGEIHNINNAEYMKLLYKKYVELKKLRDVACELGFSYDSVRHKHRAALQAFEKINLDTQIHI